MGVGHWRAASSESEVEAGAWFKMEGRLKFVSVGRF